MGTSWNSKEVTFLLRFMLYVDISFITYLWHAPVNSIFCGFKKCDIHIYANFVIKIQFCLKEIKLTTWQNVSEVWAIHFWVFLSWISMQLHKTTGRAVGPGQSCRTSTIEDIQLSNRQVYRWGFIKILKHISSYE